MSMAKHNSERLLRIIAAGYASRINTEGKPMVPQKPAGMSQEDYDKLLTVIGEMRGAPMKPIKMEKVTVWKKNNASFPWGGWRSDQADAPPPEQKKKEEPKKNQQQQQQSQGNPQSQGQPIKKSQPSQPQSRQNNQSQKSGQGKDQSGQKDKSDQNGQQDNQDSGKGNSENQPGNSQGNQPGQSKPNAKDNSLQGSQDSGEGTEPREGEGTGQEGNNNGRGGSSEQDGSDTSNPQGRKGQSGGGRSNNPYRGTFKAGHGEAEEGEFGYFSRAEEINVEIEEHGDHRIEIYDTFDDFINAADDTDKSRSSWKIRSSREKGKEEWAGTGNFQESIDLARYGWPEGVVKLDQIAEHYHQMSKWSVDRSRSLDVAGTYPIVPVFIGGDPACMVSDGDLMRGIKPVMHIMMNRGYSWMVPTGRVFNFGAALMVCIDQMETLGVRVELDVCTANYGDMYGSMTERPIWATITTIKKAQEYVEKNRMAYALANPGYSRRLKYSILEQVDKYEEPFHWGYGKPVPIPADLIPNGATYIPQLEEMLPRDQQKVWDDIGEGVKVMQKKLGITALSDGSIELTQLVEQAA